MRSTPGPIPPINLRYRNGPRTRSGNCIPFTVWPKPWNGLRLARSRESRALIVRRGTAFPSINYRWNSPFGRKQMRTLIEPYEISQNSGPKPANAKARSIAPDSASSSRSTLGPPGTTALWL